MRRTYLRILCRRAGRQAWCAVIAHSWQALVVKLVSTGLLLALAYAFVHRTAAVADDQLFSDQATIVGLAVAAAAILVFGVFLVQLLFVTPYQLWREEKERADSAEAASIPSTGIDRAAKLKEALLALKRVANAREHWRAEVHRKQGPSPLGNRPLEIINEIRQFFPPEAPGDYKEDQVSRLWNAMCSYGRELGYGHGETTRLKDTREKFESELRATTEHFEQLNDRREPTTIDIWRGTDPLELYQAACLWVGESPPTDDDGHLPPNAVHMLHRLRKGMIAGDLPYFNDPDRLKSQVLMLQQGMNEYRDNPIKIPNSVEVGRAGLRAFAETIRERPAFLFEDEE